MKDQLKAFKEGLQRVINLKYLKKFTPKELKLIIEGTEDIDIDDFKKHVKMHGYTNEDSVIQWLYQILEEMTAEDRGSVIQLWTGSRKVKPGGFK
jgi:hypothetical protein